MKRILTILLSLWIIFSSAGCSSQMPNMEKPASFYYCRSEISYNADDGVIQKELRETSQLNGDLDSILSLYLKGPQSGELARTFPVGTTLLTAEADETTVYLQLSEPFRQLTGIQRSTACACLALTVMKLTGYESVEISVRGNFEDGTPAIRMDKSSILLIDDSALLDYETGEGDEE